MKKPRDQYQDARTALLKYYNSQCMTHGGYLIAILIGLLTIISRWTTYTANIIGWIWGIVILLIGVCGYTIGRIFWWGYFASAVLYIGEKEIKEQKRRQIKILRKKIQNEEEQKREQIEKEQQEKMRIPMYILHKATATHVMEKHRWMKRFYILNVYVRGLFSKLIG